MIGHYTQIVQQNAYQVGCGLIYWHTGEQTSMFVCDYAITNMIDQPVYKIGKTASECTSGTNSNYLGLCAPNEPIDKSIF